MNRNKEKAISRQIDEDMLKLGEITRQELTKQNSLFGDMKIISIKIYGNIELLNGKNTSGT